jgi:hypothetical protein
MNGHNVFAFGNTKKGDIIILEKDDIKSGEDLRIPTSIDGHRVVGLMGFDAKAAKSVYIPETVVAIRSIDWLYDMFYSTGDDETPAPNYSCYPPIDYSGGELEKITVSKDNKYYASKSGVLYNKDFTQLVQYPAGRAAKSYTVPDTVKRIGSGAFKWFNTNLEKLTINQNVEEIGAVSFPQIDKIYFKNTKLFTGEVYDSGQASYLIGFYEDTKVYCFKNSGVHKALKNKEHKNVKFLAKPKAPDKAIIKSAKWSKGVKLTMKKQDCDLFKVYRYNKSSGKYEYIGSTKTRSFTDTTAKQGKSYKYKVAACNEKNGLKKTGKKSAAYKFSHSK